MLIKELNNQEDLWIIRKLLGALSEIWSIDIFYDRELQLEYDLAIEKSKQFETAISEVIKNAQNSNKKTLEYIEDISIDELLDSLESLHDFYSSFVENEDSEAEFMHFYKSLRNKFKPYYKHRCPSPQEIFWELLHPKIVEVTLSRHGSKHYADAVEAAFKVVIKRVKDYVNSATNLRIDGDRAMNRAFGFENQEPLIKFNKLSSEEEKDEQRGILNLFKGIVGIRNRKAHENVVLKDEVKAIEYLFLASLLMRLLDAKIKTGKSKAK